MDCPFFTEAVRACKGHVSCFSRCYRNRTNMSRWISPVPEHQSFFILLYLIWAFSDSLFGFAVSIFKKKNLQRDARWRLCHVFRAHVQCLHHSFHSRGLIVSVVQSQIATTHRHFISVGSPSSKLYGQLHKHFILLDEI